MSSLYDKHSQNVMKKLFFLLVAPTTATSYRSFKPNVVASDVCWLLNILLILSQARDQIALQY